jgi:hypothetical protein
MPRCNNMPLRRTKSKPFDPKIPDASHAIIA